MSPRPLASKTIVHFSEWEKGSGGRDWSRISLKAKAKDFPLTGFIKKVRMPKALAFSADME